MNEKSIEGVINIGNKPVVERRAVAQGRVSLQEHTKTAILSGSIKKAMSWKLQRSLPSKRSRKRLASFHTATPYRSRAPKSPGDGRATTFGAP